MEAKFKTKTERNGNPISLLRASKLWMTFTHLQRFHQKFLLFPGQLPRFQQRRSQRSSRLPCTACLRCFGPLHPLVLHPTLEDVQYAGHVQNGTGGWAWGSGWENQLFVTGAVSRHPAMIESPTANKKSLNREMNHAYYIIGYCQSRQMKQKHW